MYFKCSDKKKLISILKAEDSTESKELYYWLTKNK